MVPSFFTSASCPRKSFLTGGSCLENATDLSWIPSNFAVRRRGHCFRIRRCTFLGGLGRVFVVRGRRRRRGRFWLWHRRHRRRRRGQSRQHQSGRAPQIYRQTKNKTRHGSPKQGAFCKESNIREVVQKRANALRNCYEQQLLANPDLSGKIIVFWKIGLDGKVTDASIKSTTMNNARVESCLTQTVRRLRL